MVHFGDSSEEEGSVRNEDHDDANSDTNDANSDTNDADAAPAPVAPAPQATVIPTVPASPAPQAAAARPAPAAQRRASRRTAAPAVSSSESVISQAFNPTHDQTRFFVNLLTTVTEQAVGSGIGEDTISALQFVLHNMSLGRSVNVSAQGSLASADTATSSRSRRGGRRAGFSKLSDGSTLFSAWSPKDPTTKRSTNKQIRSRRIYGRYVAEQDVIQGTRLTTRYVDGTESEEDLSQERFTAATPFAARVFKNTTQEETRAISGPKAVKVLFEDGSERTLEKL